MTFHPSRSRLLAVATAVALTLTVPLVAAAPASAHDELLSSTPATDEALEAAPERVSLTFSDDILTLGAVVLVVDTEETNWVEGETLANESDVSAILKPGMPDGAYEMRWRVVSSDGHPISGVVPFTVGDSSGEVEPTANPTAEPSEASSAPADAGPTDQSGAGTTAGEPGNDIWRTVLVAGGGAIVALIIWIIFFAVRRRRASATTTAAENPLPNDDSSKTSR
jgi:methionine-rich copper-binding protein CopC